jgi:hypothetical protein
VDRLTVGQLDEVLRVAVPSGLRLERSVRAAAAALANSTTSMITTTTLVGVLGPDDQPAFRALIDDLVDEYGLNASIELEPGWYAVRFSRP